MTVVEYIHGWLSRLFSASKPSADQAHNRKTTISKELLESAQAEGTAVLQRLHIVLHGPYPVGKNLVYSPVCY